jgi:hypothetical protein
LENFGLHLDHLQQLLSLPSLRSVESLDLSRNPLGGAAINLLLTRWPPSLQVLKLERITYGSSLAEGDESAGFASHTKINQPLALLDLSQNTFQTTNLLRVLQHPLLEHVQSLQLRHCFRILDVAPLWRFRFWGELTELDLRDNVEDTLLPLCRPRCQPPPSLVALVVTASHLPARRQQQLRRKFHSALKLV